MGDDTESIVFYPDSIIANDLSNNENPDWHTLTTEFLSTDTYTGKINMARLYIGAGFINFIIDGVERLVEEQYMSKTFLLTRKIRDDILFGELSPSDFKLSEVEIEFVDKIISLGVSSSNYQLDIDGALIIPFTPYSIDNYDPEINSLIIEVKWDMNSALYEELGFYYMTDRVSGTCFDFEVSIKVE